jgi:hypothetical protein
MKNIKKYIGILVFVLAVSAAFAQTPPPPNNGATGSSGGTVVGGGAPIGSGMVIMLALGATYAGWKKYEEVR